MLIAKKETLMPTATARRLTALSYLEYVIISRFEALPSARGQRNIRVVFTYPRLTVKHGETLEARFDGLVGLRAFEVLERVLGRRATSLEGVAVVLVRDRATGAVIGFRDPTGHADAVLLAA
jgi:hypothetical protein